MWKAQAEHLRFDKGMSWGNIAEHLQDHFPDMDRKQVLEKVRSYLRGCKRYKEEKDRYLDREKNTISQTGLQHTRGYQSNGKYPK